MKKAKTGDRKKETIQVRVGPVECEGCGKVKSLSKTRALFSVITEDRLVCHNCV